MAQLVLLIVFFLFGCNDTNDNVVKSMPINLNELHVDQGECFSFRDSANKYFIGIVINFYKDKNGVSYIMCLSSYYDSLAPTSLVCDSLKFCGRKVMHSTPEKYIMGLDVVYASDSIVDNYKIASIGKINLDSLSNVEILAEESVNSYSGLIQAFYRSKADRVLPPDKYSDVLIKEHFRPDEYFTIKQIKDWYYSSKKE